MLNWVPQYIIEKSGLHMVHGVVCIARSWSTLYDCSFFLQVPWWRRTCSRVTIAVHEPVTHIQCYQFRLQKCVPSAQLCWFEFHSCKRYVVGKDTISRTLVVFVTMWDNNFVIVLVADWWMLSCDRKAIKTCHPLVRWSLACDDYGQRDPSSPSAVIALCVGIGDHHWSSFWFSNKQHYLSRLCQSSW